MAGAERFGWEERIRFHALLPLHYPLVLLHDYAPPEPMAPSHAVLKSETITALDAPFDVEGLGLPVERLTRQALHCTETTVQAIDHALNNRVGKLLGDSPKSNLVALPAPLSFKRMQVFS